MVGSESEGLGIQDFESNRIETFSLLTSRVRVNGVNNLLHLLRCKRHRVQEQLVITGKDGYQE